MSVARVVCCKYLNEWFWTQLGTQIFVMTMLKWLFHNGHAISFCHDLDTSFLTCCCKGLSSRNQVQIVQNWRALWKKGITNKNSNSRKEKFNILVEFYEVMFSPKCRIFPVIKSNWLKLYLTSRMCKWRPFHPPWTPDTRLHMTAVQVGLQFFSMYMTMTACTCWYMYDSGGAGG